MKEINGYKNLYWIDENGIIINRHGRKLKTHLNTHGYPVVGLSKNNSKKIFSIHRLIAEAFIPNPENKPHINHKDGIKTNHNINNLEWCTPSENMLHAFKIGLKNHKGENNNANRKLSNLQVQEIRDKYITKKYSQTKLAREYSITQAQISYIISKKRW